MKRPNSSGRGNARRRERGEVRGVQQPRGHRHRQSQRGDAEEEARNPQRGDAHGHRHGRRHRHRAQERQEEVGAARRHEAGAHRATDAGDGELAQAHLAGPPGQDHQRDSEDGEHPEVGHEDQARVVEERGHQHGDDGQDRGQREARHAQLGQSAQDIGDGSDFGDRQFATAGHAFVSTALGQQSHEHDEEEGDVDGGGPRVVPEHHLAEHTDTQGSGKRDAQAFHSGHHRGGQRTEQRCRSGDPAEVGADDGDGEDGAEAGQTGGDHPGDLRQPTHGNAQQQRPLRRIGRGADGDAEIAAAEEPRQRGQHHRHDDDRGDVVGAEHDRSDPEAHLQRGHESLGAVDVEERGERDLTCTQHLCDTDGGYRQDEPGRGEEPADHQTVDHETGEHCHRQRKHEGQEVGQPGTGHEHDGDASGQTADVGLREVDDAGSPEHEHQPEGGQRLERSEHEAERDHTGGHPVGKQRASHDPHRRHRRHRDADRAGERLDGRSPVPLLGFGRFALSELCHGHANPKSSHVGNKVVVVVVVVGGAVVVEVVVLVKVVDGVVEVVEVDVDVVGNDVGSGASDVVVTTGSGVSDGSDDTGPDGGGSALRPRPKDSGIGLRDGTITITTRAAKPTTAEAR